MKVKGLLTHPVFLLPIVILVTTAFIGGLLQWLMSNSADNREMEHEQQLRALKATYTQEIESLQNQLSSIERDIALPPSQASFLLDAESLAVSPADLSTLLYGGQQYESVQEGMFYISPAESDVWTRRTTSLLDITQQWLPEGLKNNAIPTRLKTVLSEENILLWEAASEYVIDMGVDASSMLAKHFKQNGRMNFKLTPMLLVTPYTKTLIEAQAKSIFDSKTRNGLYPKTFLKKIWDGNIGKTLAGSFADNLSAHVLTLVTMNEFALAQLFGGRYHIQKIDQKAGLFYVKSQIFIEQAYVNKSEAASQVQVDIESFIFGRPDKKDAVLVSVMMPSTSSDTGKQKLLYPWTQAWLEKLRISVY
ncbi:MAG: hypothetical protein AAF512_23290 [Pseudomonadota bacterium]